MNCANCKQKIADPAPREVSAYGERLGCFCSFFCIAQWIKYEGWELAARKVAYSKEMVIR